MPRTMPYCPGDIDFEKLDHHPGMVARMYDIEVITPMFGGGVDAGKIDPEHPIRESSIRGHLRFWWRATRGASFSDVRELRQREGEIWGSTENPSPVILQIGELKNKKMESCATYRWDNNPENQGGQKWRLVWNTRYMQNVLPYVLFPFQGKPPKKSDPNKNPRPQTEAIVPEKYEFPSFSLSVLFTSENHMKTYAPEYNRQRKKKDLPLLQDSDYDIQKDIDASIWAWVNFGGIGARTRRGCGALSGKQISPDSDKDIELGPSVGDEKSLSSWYTSHCKKYSLNFSVTRQWPTMPAVILVKPLTVNEAEHVMPVIQAWAESIRIMKEFRQGLPGRNFLYLNNGRAIPKRSRWPEAEALREYVYGPARTVKPTHLVQPTLIHSVDTRMTNVIHLPDLAFPRVEFGMPIILEIHGEKIKPTLQYSKEIDRMASPLILRCLKCGDGMCVAMIIRLNNPPLESAYVKPGDPEHDDNTQNARAIQQAEIQNTSLTSYPNSPMATRCTNGSALDAFLTFAEKENDFRKVG